MKKEIITALSGSYTTTELYDALIKLPQIQFNGVIISLRIPKIVLPDASAPQPERSEAVLKYIGSTKNLDLEDLANAIQRFSPNLLPQKNGRLQEPRVGSKHKWLLALLVLGIVALGYKFLISTAECGNQKLEQGEICDDGNTTPGDGCEPTCLLINSQQTNSKEETANTPNISLQPKALTSSFAQKPSNLKAQKTLAPKETLLVEELPKNVPSQLPLHISIFFDTNSPQLSQENRVKLNEIAIIMKGSEDIELWVEGYTDKQKTLIREIEISEARALAVRDYLIFQGINPARMTGIGCGKKNPRITIRNEEGKQQNHRVEFSDKKIQSKPCSPLKKI